MGTFDAWVRVDEKRSWMTDKTLAQAWAEDREIFLYGITTLGDEKYLAFRAKAGEIEDDVDFMDEIIWACDDGYDSWPKFIERVIGRDHPHNLEPPSDFKEKLAAITEYWCH